MLKRLFALFVGPALIGSLVANCGGSDDESSGGKGGTGGSSTGGSSGDASLGGSGGGGGSGGSAGADSGAATCPPYQDLCNGKCISTVLDPNNCGGCGVTCPTGQVCAGGGCLATCLPGTEACAGACIDTDVDNANCGSCGVACPSGKGCVGGKCEDTATLGTPPAACAGGSGPPVNLDPTTDKCAGNTGATTFTWAICSCKDVFSSAKLLVDGFDSTKGPYQPGQLGGGVGANGEYTSSSTADVWGTMWTASALGLKTSNDQSVHNELYVGGPVTTQQFDVTNDAFINGDVKGNTLAVGKTLTVPTTATVAGATYTKLVNAPVSVAPPCACAPNEILPIAAWVAAAKTNNDNAAIGLDPALLTQATQPGRVDLPCGRYYLDAIAAKGPLAIVAHGNVALFIAGDVTSSTFLELTLDPTAELDIVIGGTIVSSSTIKLGSANYPALCRTYVGGSADLWLSANFILGANIYAANAPVTWTANTDAFGAVFAGDFKATADTKIHYDRAVVTIGEKCPPPPSDGGTTCGSCADCNNQACVNGACGQCGSNTDCCPPLECVSGSCIQVVK